MADAAVADPKVEPKPAETPTPEQIAAQVDDFKVGNALFNNPRMKTGWDKPAEPPPAPEPAATDAPPADEPKPDDAPPTNEPAAPPVAAAPPAPDAAEQARIDAAVDAHLKKSGLLDGNLPPPLQALPIAESPPAQLDTPAALGADAHLLEVFTEMEKMDKRNRGLAKRIQEFRATENAYRRDWITKNPGQRFIPAAEDHNEFYAQNEPPFDQNEFRAAEDRIKEARIEVRVREKVMNEVAPELNEIRREREMAKLTPIIAKAADEAGTSVLTAVPEHGKENKDFNDFAKKESERAMAIVAEIEKMDKVPGYMLNESIRIKLPNGETIRPHSEILNSLDELESEYASKPERDQIRNGKRFISVAERAAYSAQVQQSTLPEAEKQKRLADLKNHFWAITADDIKKHEINKSKARIQDLAKILPPKSQKQPESIAHKNGSNGKLAEAAKPAAVAPRSGSSDTATASDVVASRVPGAKSVEKISDVWFR